MEEKVDDSELFLWIVMCLFFCEVIPVTCWACVKFMKICNKAKTEKKKREFELAAGVNDEGYGRD